MYRRILIAGSTAAVVIGAGTTALAVTGSDTTSGTPSSPTSSSAPSGSGHSGSTGDHGKGKNGKKGKHKLLHRLSHGQIVTKGKGGFVTHDLIHGTVTSVSATSITVQAADKKSETFTVTKDTKVRERKDGKGESATISKVAKGDHVLVAGTGTSKLTAKHVVDVGTK